MRSSLSAPGLHRSLHSRMRFSSPLEAAIARRGHIACGRTGHPTFSPGRSSDGTVIIRIYRRVFVERHGVGPAKYRPLPRPSVFVDKDDLVQRSFQHTHDFGDFCPAEINPARILPARNSPPLVESAIETWTCQWYSSWGIVAHGLYPLYQVTRIVGKSLS